MTIMKQLLTTTSTSTSTNNSTTINQTGGYRANSQELAQLVRELAVERKLFQSEVNSLVRSILATSANLSNSLEFEFEPATDWDRAKIARGSLKRGMSKLNLTRQYQTLAAWEGKLVKAVVSAIQPLAPRPATPASRKTVPTFRVELEISEAAFVRTARESVGTRAIMLVHDQLAQFPVPVSTPHEAESEGENEGGKAASLAWQYQVGQEIYVLLNRLVYSRSEVGSTSGHGHGHGGKKGQSQAQGQAQAQESASTIATQKTDALSGKLPASTTKPTVAVSTLALQQQLIDAELEQEQEPGAGVMGGLPDSGCLLPTLQWYWVASCSGLEYVTRLFEKYLPELEVKAIARQAGRLCKVAVATAAQGQSNRKSTQPAAGSAPDLLHPNFKDYEKQLLLIRAALPAGEQLGLIAYTTNTRKFIARALAPATIPAQAVQLYSNPATEAEAEVEGRTTKPQAVVTISAELIGRAIGQSGINVRLAAELTGYCIKLEAVQFSAAKTKAKQVSSFKNQKQKHKQKRAA